MMAGDPSSAAGASWPASGRRSSRHERDIDIFLPPSYARSRRRYPVIYMQDGQNLADPHRAFAGTWELDAGAGDLAARGLEIIVVGVPNSGAERMREYSRSRIAASAAAAATPIWRSSSAR